jgi:uncharacterized protein (DUF433 family)
MATSRLRLYDGDAREAPAYGLTEAAHYLGIPTSTLRSWTLGQPYTVRDETRWFAPVIQIADPDRRLLSFWNLFEAYVCDAIRREHHVPLQRIRYALQIAQKIAPGSRHPLVELQLVTSGLDLFIEEYGRLINATPSGQMAMRESLEMYLKRVDRDALGLVAKLYPFTRKPRPSDSPKVVVIDARVAFGRPVIAGTRIPTSAVYDRWRAGESIPLLAEDYGRSIVEIEEALRCETTEAA